MLTARSVERGAIRNNRPVDLVNDQAQYASHMTTARKEP